MNHATIDYLERVALWVTDKSDGSRSFAVSFGYRPDTLHAWAVAIVDLSVSNDPWLGVDEDLELAFAAAIDQAQAQLGDKSP